MKLLSAILMLAVSQASARPAPGLTPPPKPEPRSSEASVEQRLREWLRAQSYAKPAVARDMADLKDAVAAPSGLSAEISKARGGQRRRLSERLPGMAENPEGFCRSLRDCRQARASFHVEDESLIPEAAAALVRPWILLEQARSGALDFSPAKSGDRLIELKLSRLPQAGLSLHVAAVPAGGYDLWLAGATDPSALFRKERAAAIAREP